LLDRQHVERITAEVLGRIDRKGFEMLRRRHLDDRSGSPSKYLDLDRWIMINARRAVALGLAEVDQQRRVLDIGTGCGYFPLVCKHLGHEVVALDCADRGQLFRDVADLLGVDVVTYDVKPFAGMPSIGMFDVIGAFMITFNGHCSDAVWGSHEWYWLFNALEAMLRRGGTMVFELNREPSSNVCYTPELESFFADRGGRFSGSWPHHPEPGGHRVVFKR
jgi:SAM-dependent methyltransferase